MIKLLALGALAYFGYRYMQKQAEPGLTPAVGQAPVAGGPISKHATLQSDPDQPPAIDPYS